MLPVGIGASCKNGFECLKESRSASCFDDVQVIMLSASSSSIHIEMSRKLGADFYAVKPGLFQDLKGLLQQILEEGGSKGTADRSKFLLSQKNGCFLKLAFCSGMGSPCSLFGSSLPIIFFIPIFSGGVFPSTFTGGSLLGSFFHEKIEIPQMPPCRTAVWRTVEVSDSYIAALKENLRIGDLCPLCPLDFFRRGTVLKMAFYIFVIHAAKIIQNTTSGKAGIGFTAHLTLHFP